MVSTTPNKGYILQSTGSNINTWGVTLDGIFSQIDQNLGGTLSLPLTNSSVTLTSAQAGNVFYYLSGTLTGSVVLTFPSVGGFYIVANNCTIGGYTVTARSSTTGQAWPVNPGLTLLVTDGINMFGSVTVTDIATINSTIAALTTTVNTKQGALGFTPVQQGGGAGQGTNKIYLGWDGANGLLRLTVDATDEGDLALTSWVANHYGTIANVTAAAPPGEYGFFAMSSAPAGWLVANGAAVSRTAYANLFGQISTYYGAGDGSTTFNLPDIRGLYLRAYDNGRGMDPTGAAFGSYYGDTYASHSHPVNDPGHAHGVYDPGHNHGVNDPQHGHVVHCTQADSNGGWPDGGYGNSPGVVNPYSHTIGNPTSNSSGTGIWLNASGTGIGIYGAGTGIYLSASGGSETSPRHLNGLGCIKY